MQIIWTEWVFQKSYIELLLPKVMVLESGAVGG